MPQIGSEQKPMMIGSKKRGKVLGMTGGFYKPENKKKYDDNYDRILGEKKMKHGDKKKRSIYGRHGSKAQALCSWRQSWLRKCERHGKPA